MSSSNNPETKTADAGEEESWFKRALRNLVPDFSIGNIFSWAFWGLIFAGIFYAVIQYVPGAKDWLKENATGISAFLEEKLGIDMGGAQLAYFAEQSEADKIKMLTDKKIGMSPEMAQVVASNFDAISTAVKASHPGLKFDKKFLTDDKTINYILANNPELAAKLLGGMKPGGATTGAAAGSGADATTQAVLASVAGIIKDPARFKALLQNPATFDVLMQQASAVASANGMPINAQALGKFIRETGIGPDGTPTPAFTKLATQLLTTSGKQEINNAVLAYAMPFRRSESARAVLAAIDTSSLSKDDPLRVAGEAAKDKVKYNFMNDMADRVGGDAAALRLKQTLDSGNKGDITRLLLQPEIRAAVRYYQNHPDQVPADYAAPFAKAAELATASPEKIGVIARLQDGGIREEQLQHMQTMVADAKKAHILDRPALATKWVMNNLLTPNFLNQLVAGGNLSTMGDLMASEAKGTKDPAMQFLTLKTPAKNGGMEYGNLKLVAALTKRAQADPQKQSVILGMIGMVSQDARAFDGISKQAFVQFMANDSNRADIKYFLNHVQLPAGLPEDRQLLKTLSSHWGDKTHGFSEILTSGKDAELVYDIMRGYAHGQKASSVAQFLHDNTQFLDGVAAYLSQTAGGLGLNSSKIAENLSDVRALEASVNAAQAAHARTTTARQRK